MSPLAVLAAMFGRAGEDRPVCAAAEATIVGLHRAAMPTGQGAGRLGGGVVKAQAGWAVVEPLAGADVSPVAGYTVAELSQAPRQYGVQSPAQSEWLSTRPELVLRSVPYHWHLH